MKIAISGASGKTGYRIAEEAIKENHEVRLLVRKNSKLPESLNKCKKYIIDLNKDNTFEKPLKDINCLIIATGARPSIDLTGPARIDAFGVKTQVDCCKKNNVKRIILVSSLCAGRFIHPLNLFGLILYWKRIGEKSLENSGLDWTVIRPGGLTEEENNLKNQNILYTSADMQEDASIPRRLVAKTCIEALKTVESIGKIIEVTSGSEVKANNMKKAIGGFILSK
tara:strand:- start:1507 stop:2181 length:675 start_codon:yes stop_codon:yes gene_type:complete